MKIRALLGALALALDAGRGCKRERMKERRVRAAAGSACVLGLKERQRAALAEKFVGPIPHGVRS